MDVQIERAPESLDHGHRAAAPIGDTVAARACTQGAEHRAEEHGDDRPTQAVIPRQLVPQAVGQTQHPLSYGDVGEHMIEHVGGALGHPTATATWTDRAALAREGDEAVEGAIVAVKPGKPTGEPTTAEEVAKLLLDEPRQSLTVAETRGLGPKGLEVIADHLIDRPMPRASGFVARGRQGHTPW